MRDNARWKTSFTHKATGCGDQKSGKGFLNSERPDARRSTGQEFSRSLRLVSQLKLERPCDLVLCDSLHPLEELVGVPNDLSRAPV
jgi:hypothetical protein